MKQELQVFNFENNEVRTVVKNGEPWFVGKDVAGVLGYKNPTIALQDNVDSEDKGVTKVTTLGGVQNVTIINESGLYSLVFGSRLPNAKTFKHWVTAEVLPAIRKTGGYKLKETDERLIEIKANNSFARKKNAQVREADYFLKLADRSNVETYKQIMLAYSTKALSGEFLLPLPAAPKKTYSAGEIGDMFGVSSNKIGRLANVNNLKTDEYGVYVWNKAEHSARECRVFRYYEEAIAVFAKLLEAVA